MKIYNINGQEIIGSLHSKKIDWAKRDRNNNIAVACALAVLYILSCINPIF